jgi:hypothetical protein
MKSNFFVLSISTLVLERLSVPLRVLNQWQSQDPLSPWRRVIVERRRAAVGREIVGAEPLLPHDDGVGQDRADLLGEARKVEGDLGIGRTIVRNSRGHGLRLAEAVDLNHPGDDRAGRHAHLRGQVGQLMEPELVVRATPQ